MPLPHRIVEASIQELLFVNRRIANDCHPARQPVLTKLLKALHDLVAASQAGRVQIGRLIAGLVKAPGEIAALLRLARRYRTAMRSLRTVGTHLA